MKYCKEKICLATILVSVLLSVPLPINCFLNCILADQIKLVGLNEVNLEKKNILLKDLVHVFGGNDELRKKIELIEIGAILPPGNDIVVDEKDIRLCLKKANLESNQIEIVLSKPILVKRVSMEISSDFIKTAIEKYIKSHSSEKKSTVLIKDIFGAESIILPNGNLTYSIEPKYHSDLLGKVHLMMFLYIDGEFHERLSLAAKVEKVADVIVAKTPICRGQVIEPSNLKFRSVELSQLKGKPFMDLDGIVGKSASKQIYPEMVVLANDVEIPPVLKRGDTVRIIVTYSNITATARGLARENGRVGEKIRVVNIDSKKSLFATVLDRHTVKIEF